MSKYKTLHMWMIIPLIIMQFGIYKDYWGDFSDNAWSVHIHYWTGTIWYLYLIIQPYFATHGQMQRHRTNGIIGMLRRCWCSIFNLFLFKRSTPTTRTKDFSVINPKTSNYQ